MEGFSSFEIADFRFWDMEVHGMTWETLGKKQKIIILFLL